VLLQRERPKAFFLAARALLLYTLGTTGTGGILKGRMPVLAEAPDIPLHSGLSGQKKDQQADKRNDESGRPRFHSIYK